MLSGVVGSQVGKFYIPTDGLIAAYAMDTDAGGVLVDSFGANNGSITGAVIAPGKILNSLSFDGINDIASVPHSAILIPDAFSVSMWLKTTTTSNLVAAEKDGNNGWSIQTANSIIAGNFGGPVGQVVLACGVGSNRLRSGVAINDGNWHHVVVVSDFIGGVARIYVDGAHTSPTSGLGSTINGTPSYGAGPLVFGQRPTNIAPFLGSIDSVRYYSRAVSSQEVEQLYNESTQT